VLSDTAGEQRQEAPVRTSQEAVLLRVFVGEADRTEGGPLYRVIVAEAQAAGLAGATVLHGPIGFGAGRQINCELNVEAPGNPPIVIEIIDTEERIQDFLPRLDQLVGSGLVTMEKLRMLRCGRKAGGG
jgi:uncharacterized protein